MGRKESGEALAETGLLQPHSGKVQTHKGCFLSSQNSPTKHTRRGLFPRYWLERHLYTGISMDKGGNSFLSQKSRSYLLQQW